MCNGRLVTVMAIFGAASTFVGYVLAFGLAATVCLGGLVRARRVEDPDTRRGLVGLLATSGSWAGFQTLFLVLPSTGLKYAAYVASLIVGLATIGAWLYFCSAYTGRTLHRDAAFRWLAVVVYLGIVAVKLTNPFHGLYFTTAAVTEPFPHLTIMHETVHWVVTGLSYALVGVGFFMLFELFEAADYDTRPLAVVVGVTGLPVVLDVVGYATPTLIDINYEPLGVALFAAGVLYLFEERFLAVQLTGDVDQPVVFLTDDGRIRDFNGGAGRLFPELRGAVGEPLAETLPEVADMVEEETAIVDREVDGETRHYLLGESSFTLGQADIGQVLLFADVTETERQRRELRRHNDQLEGLAAAIRHELRNTIQIVRGRVEIAGDALDGGDVGLARESFETASDTAERMSRIVEDLSALAQHGQTLQATHQVTLGDAADRAWTAAETGDASLTVEHDGPLEADGARLRELLEHTFEFAVRNGAEMVTVSFEDGGFTVAGDGDPPGDRDPEEFFDYGGSVPDSEAGLALPNVRTLARVHGWTASIDTDYTEGIRLAISGIETASSGAEKL